VTGRPRASARTPRAPIGLLGIGRMGSAVARRLLADGIPLLLWNRTRARAEAVARAPARVADRPDEVFARCRLVLLVVLDHAAARRLLRGQRRRLAGRTVALLTDLAPAESDRLRALVTAAGGAYVEAQLYATAAEVGARRARVLVAGAEGRPTRAVAGLLRRLGRVHRLGAPPAASVLKVALLNLYLAMVPAAATSVALLERRGIPPRPFVAATRDRGAFPPFVADLVRRMVARDFAQPINDLRGLAKDLAVLAAALRGAGLPRGAALSAPLRRVVGRAAGSGAGAEDMCRLVELIQPASPAPRRAGAGRLTTPRADATIGRSRPTTGPGRDGRG